MSLQINQSIKTHFYSAICRERIRGTVKEIEKDGNRRYDTSDRHTSLFYRAIDLYAGTYYESMIVSID